MGAAAIPLIGSVIGSVFQVGQARRAERQANNESQRAARAQAQLTAGLEQQNQQTIAGQAAYVARQQRLAAGAMADRSTILTGPMGLSAAPGDNGQRKTLLGQ